MSIYYKYTPDISKIVVLSYVDDCVYWYTNEDIGKWFVDTLGKIFHVNFLGYATSIVAKYLDTAIIKVGTNVYKASFPSDMIFTKENVSTSDEQVEKLTREFNIHYRGCISSLI